ncbi:MAG: hypothetical protein WB869_04110 [Candidatus Acidiferrales bacterium]
MKKSLFSSFMALAMLALLTGCGGGSSNSGGSGSGGTGSPMAASLLSGQYAFTFSGQNDAGPISIIGSFAADGKGSITGGVEDVTLVKKSSDTIGAQAGMTFTGTYTVGSDGRGTLTFNTSSDGAQNFAIVIESNNQGQLIWFDNSATGSGTFSLQDTTAFTASTLNGSFAFGLNGIDQSQNPYSRVGVFSSSSGSVANGGESDLNNYYGTGGINLAQPITGGSVGAPNSSTGRGTLALIYNSLTVNYIYYVVSANTLNLIEADDQASVYGTASLQSGGPFSAASLSGNYVISIGGSSVAGALAETGQFSADGVGTVSGVVDENNNGTATQNATLSGVFTSVTSNGRGTMGLTFPSGTISFAFYLASNSNVYLMEMDSDAMTSGQALAQSAGPFTTSSLTGNYGLQFSGSDGGVEVDFSGQAASSGSGTLSSGTIDSNFAGFLTNNPEPYFGSTAISGGSYTVTSSTAGRGTIGFNLGSTAMGFAYYFISPTQIVLIETDVSGQVTQGSGQTQPTIP